MELTIMPLDYLAQINTIAVSADLGVFQDTVSGDRITLLADGEHVVVCPQ